MKKVNLFIPCFVDQIYPQSAMNMAKVLEKAGCEVDYNTNQTCCGQPAYNAGFQDESCKVASKFLRDFKAPGYIVAPSASCVGFVKNYYKTMISGGEDKALLDDISGRIYEFSQFLTEVLNVTDFGAALPGKAAYHDSCAALRECGIKAGPRKLLANVKGLELTEMHDNETCCGFGGTFAVKFESISIAMAEQKTENALATGAEYLISTDLSCLMQIGGVIKSKNLPIKAMHLADVLASGW